MAAVRLSPLLVVVGETASGKSELAMRLAEEFNGEIICADSWTVRREVNIGTAKPSRSEQSRVSHHLLDVVAPCGDFTAAVFKKLANKAIKNIASRGKMPILAGGTGLYIDGVIFDFNFLPAGDRGARESFNTLNVEQLLAEIDILGIETGGVDVRNKRRLIRLIETNGAEATRQALRPNTLIIGLKTDRPVLKDRIEKRVDAMINNGLEGEVRRLVDKYGWDCEALKGVGYSQWKNYFLGTENIDLVRQKIIKDTCDLAKRQRTWFKRNKSIQWLNTPVKWDEVVDITTTFLKTNPS